MPHSDGPVQRSTQAAVLRVDCRGQSEKWKTNFLGLTVGRGEMMVARIRVATADITTGGQILDIKSIFFRKTKQDRWTRWDLLKWT